MLSLSRSFAFYVFSFSSITSITNHINNLTDRQLDSDRRSDRRSDRSVIEVIEERFLTTKLQEFTTYIIDLMGNGVRYPMKLKD